jgi:hypothetical protein
MSIDSLHHQKRAVLRLAAARDKRAMPAFRRASSQHPAVRIRYERKRLVAEIHGTKRRASTRASILGNIPVE